MPIRITERSHQKQHDSELLHKFIQNKLSKLEKLARVTDIEVILDVDNIRHIAEANVFVPNKVINAKAESEDMYKSIDLLQEKLTRQMIKYKEKFSDHQD